MGKIYVWDCKHFLLNTINWFKFIDVFVTWRGCVDPFRVQPLILFFCSFSNSSSTWSSSLHHNLSYDVTCFNTISNLLIDVNCPFCAPRTNKPFFPSHYHPITLWMWHLHLESKCNIYIYIYIYI